MALSEIIINDVVRSQTKAFISESNYHLLRQYLLERKPLLRVLNPINSLLFEHCNLDKQTVLTNLTQLAFESQKKHDDEEAISDEQEKQNEWGLKEQYANELVTLESKLEQLETKCSQQEIRYNQTNRQVTDLKIRLSQLTSNLDRIRNERQMRHPQISFHTHPTMSQQQRLYPELPFQEQLTWDRLLQDENRLLEEQQTLIYQISAKETERTKEKQSLTQYLQEKKETEKRYQEIKHQLDIVLPENDQHRQMRAQERFSRDSARNNYGYNIQQLSPKNLEELKQQIETHSLELDNQRSQLLSDATEISYKTYLTQLEFALQHSENGPKVVYAEQVALKTILALMKNVTEMTDKESVLLSELNDEQNNLRALQKNLQACARHLQNYLTAKPHLVKQNKELNENNFHLKLKSESAASHKTHALYLSLFSITSSLVTTSLIGMFIISPVFFTIPGALAMLSVVAVAVAFGFHYQKYTSEQHIKQNIQIIEKNDVILMKDWKEANNLSVTAMAEINTKIEQAEKNVVELEQQLNDQQHVISLALNKAQSVSSSYNGNSNFFNSNPTGNVVYLPSAPALEEPLYPSLRNF